MAAKTVEITPALYDYILGHWVREPDVLRRLREETATMPNSGLQISPEQGPIIGLLIKLIGAKRGVEMGTFTGYSSIAAALAMPDDGELICCDVNPETTAVARRYWKEAGVDDKVRLVLAPALETLDGLLADGQAGSFDYAFIDADKSNYILYYERSVTLLRSGGLILIDNVLWHGRLTDPEANDADTLQMREMNRMIFEDSRVDVALIPVADGLTMVRKR